MSFEDTFPGQNELINKILKHPVGMAFQLEELEAMDREQLQRAAQWVRENPSIHHAAGTTNPRPIAPARVAPADPAPPVEALPSWAQQAAIANRTRISKIAPKRYRAVVWDAERCLTIHLGVFDSIEARDAAVRDAKARRAIGLPLRG